MGERIKCHLLPFVFSAQWGHNEKFYVGKLGKRSSPRESQRTPF
jgi:hypothetical protein